MAAYLLADLTERHAQTFEAYRQAVPAVIARFGGRHIVRGGTVEAKEGDPGLHRVVIPEFPDMAAARAVYDSPAHAPLLALRLEAAGGMVALVEGVVA